MAQLDPGDSAHARHSSFRDPVRKQFELFSRFSVVGPAPSNAASERSSVADRHRDPGLCRDHGWQARTGSFDAVQAPARLLAESQWHNRRTKPCGNRRPGDFHGEMKWATIMLPV